MGLRVWREARGRQPASRSGRLRVVVACIGVSGFAAADGLLSLGVHVTVVDRSEDERTRRGILRLPATG